MQSKSDHLQRSYDTAGAIKCENKISK